MEKQQAELEINMIKKIMEDSRRIVIDDGAGYIVWGFLVIIALLSTYFIVLAKQFNYIVWVWLILMGGGWIYTIFHYRKKETRAKVKTFAGKILGGVWISAGISMTLIGFVGSASGAIGGYAISPLISVILGIAYFTSGIIYMQNWIKYLSIGWWAGAVIMFLWPGVNSFLIFSAMMALLQVLPGIILYSKFKKEYRTNENG